jgi:hypothetical protein
MHQAGAFERKMPKHAALLEKGFLAPMWAQSLD